MEIPSHARGMVASAVATHARRRAASVANPPPLRKADGTLSPVIPSAHSQTALKIPEHSRHPLLAGIDRAPSSCALVAIAAAAMSVWRKEMSVARTSKEISSHAREAVVSAVATHARRRAASAAHPTWSRKVAGTLSQVTRSAHSE